jgi:hypothetical protein
LHYLEVVLQAPSPRHYLLSAWKYLVSTSQTTLTASRPPACPFSSEVFTCSQVLLPASSSSRWVSNPSSLHHSLSTLQNLNSDDSQDVDTEQWTAEALFQRGVHPLTSVGSSPRAPRLDFEPLVSRLVHGLSERIILSFACQVLLGVPGLSKEKFLAAGIHLWI